jgi:D-alanyl-D-alanine carboxypeptidase/D-alanyl-D-alanine-endopeptidase (penicillin-binding protein 4)
MRENLTILRPIPSFILSRPQRVWSDRGMKSFRAAAAPLIFSVLLGLCHESHGLDLQALLKNGGTRVEKEDGTPLIQYRDNEPFVPASTLKVATTFCVLEALGKDFRFTTTFYRAPSNTLYIKGSGDPSLVSEELNSIAQKLGLLMPRVNRIVIDPTLFSPEIDIDGSSASLNPYDSKVAAFVGNYSSAALTRRKDGTVVSAEPQTPLTPLSRQAGLKLKRGTSERINLGHTWQVGTQYGGELLAEFLKRAGASGTFEVSIGKIPSDATKIYEHRSSKALAEVSQGLLKYSTNFTANQLFLTLGINKYGAPATVEKGQLAMTECLQQKVGWRDFHIEEGSGLSRRNRVTPLQMTKLLESFEPYRDLLNVEDNFTAKTGSLRGVNTLAGYFDLSPSERVRFAILVNSEVEHSHKYKVAKALRDYLLQRQGDR